MSILQMHRDYYEWALTQLFTAASPHLGNPGPFTKAPTPDGDPVDRCTYCASLDASKEFADERLRQQAVDRAPRNRAAYGHAVLACPCDAWQVDYQHAMPTTDPADGDEVIPVMAYRILTGSNGAYLQPNLVHAMNALQDHRNTCTTGDFLLGLGGIPTGWEATDWQPAQPWDNYNHNVRADMARIVRAWGTDQ